MARVRLAAVADPHGVRRAGRHRARLAARRRPLHVGHRRPVARVEEAGRPALGHGPALHPRAGGLHLPAPLLELLGDRLAGPPAAARARAPARPAGSARPRRRSAAWPARPSRACSTSRSSARISSPSAITSSRATVAHPLERRGLLAPAAPPARQPEQRRAPRPARQTAASRGRHRRRCRPRHRRQGRPRWSCPLPARLADQPHELGQHGRRAVARAWRSNAWRASSPARPRGRSSPAAPARNELPITAAYTPGSSTVSAIFAQRRDRVVARLVVGRLGQHRDVERPRLVVGDLGAQVVGFAVGDPALGVRGHVDGVELERLRRVVERVLRLSRTRRHEQRRDADEEDAHDLSLPAGTRYNLHVSLPPGPRLPRLAQAAVVTAAPYAWMAKRRERYGDVFSSHFPFFGRVVYVADPALVKEVFTGDPEHLPRRRGQRHRPGRRARRQLAAHARRGPAHVAAQAAAAALPRRRGAPLRRGDGGGHRARGRRLAGRPRVRAAAAHAGDHARGDPARGVRRARRRAHGPVPRAHPAARQPVERARLAAVHAARPGRPDAGRALPQGGRGGRRADLRGDRRAARDRRRGRPRRRAHAAALAPATRTARR